MQYQHIRYEPGKVARIRLNRPKYHNAQSWLMCEEMSHAFQTAGDDETVGCIVLSGEGRHFSVGHDIGTEEDKTYRREHGHTPGNRMQRHAKMRDMTFEKTLRWRNIPKPTLAMVHGYCLFGGWMFASAMDIIFAAETALFLPTHFQYFSVPWEMTPRKAKEVIFEHRFMPAWEACDHGFVNRVFPEAQLEAETLAYADRVAESCLLDPLRVKMTKFSINHAMDAMGFTTELENAYNNYCLMRGLETRDLPHPDQGGLARVGKALENLEKTKPWLEAAQNRKKET
jgi:enoyl-CoA hydratase